MVFVALRGSTNGLQGPALERYVNLALSKLVDSRLCIFAQLASGLLLLS
jgi:hypothetical protein